MNPIKIVVTGHGTFASGIKGALQLLAKIPDSWGFVNFTEGMSEGDLKIKFQELLAKNAKEPLVFFTDLAGGTPFKTAVTCADGHDNIKVVAGCNLGSLLEIIFSDFTSAQECANKIVATSLAGTQCFDAQAPLQDQSPQDGEAGI